MNDTDATKTRIVGVRFTETERGRLLEAADAAGESVSDLVRWKLRDVIQGDRTPTATA